MANCSAISRLEKSKQLMSERISYWLVPAEPDDEELRYIMCDIDGWIIDAVSFDPHVTLYSGRLVPSDDVPAILESATRGISEITLRATGIGHSEQFTQTLFVEFAFNEVLLQLSHLFKQLSSQPSDYGLKPHLSLVYANLSAEVREYFAGKTSVPPLVRFDRVKAIKSRWQIRTPEDVEAWRVVAEARLGVS